MKENELIPHLFRTEYGKITAVLYKRFGFDHMETAEDIASETFLAASELWSLKGLPENPVAWLYTVAKNKAKNHLKHQQIFQDRIAKDILHTSGEALHPDIDLSARHIKDSQLQMMFAVCHPSIPAEAQIGLALRILCGFGIGEIADAFLSNKETINKRLMRAKEKLREENIQITFPPEQEIGKRLDMVLRTLYLLFNEGYYSASQNSQMRKELCLEAMRLTQLLIENPATNLPPVNALYALMSFQASRFEARMDSNGEIILYNDQDTGLWNRALITQGEYFLNLAAQGNKLSAYHLEAGIAYWHTIREDSHQKWENILQLYNHLLALEYSPVAALNRTFALSKARGKPVAIGEARKLKLDTLPLYHLLMGELLTGVENSEAIDAYEKARQLTSSETEKKIISEKILALKASLLHHTTY